MSETLEKSQLSEFLMFLQGVNLLCTCSERVFNTPFMSCSRSVLENADEEMWELYFYCEKADDLPSFVNKCHSSATHDAILTSGNISINCV